MGIISAKPDLSRHGVVGRPTGGGDIVGWSIPHSIPGFNAGMWKPKRRLTPKQFQTLMGFAVVAGRRGLPGLGQYSGPQFITAASGQIQTGCVNPSVWSKTPGPGCTPVGDGNCSTALYGAIPCSDVRECDTMTGCVHYEFALPSGTPGNVDITEIDPNTGKSVGFSDSTFTVGNTGPIKAGTQVVNPSTGVEVYQSPGPSGGGAKTTTPPPAGSAGSAASVQVVLQNSSRPGQPFQVGDNFLLTISGPPNAAVVNSATQNGVSVGSTNYGSTDGNGSFSLSGTMTPGTVGTWAETWTVGTSSASLSFSVAAANPGTTGSGGSGETGGGGSTSTTVPTVSSPPPAAATTTGFSFFGLSGTMLLVIAGAVVLLMLLFRGGRR
jgi:hypothetical protein